MEDTPRVRWRAEPPLSSKASQIHLDSGLPDSAAAKPYLALGQIRPLLDIITTAGLAPTSILARAGVAGDLFDQVGATPVTLSDYFRICEQLALQGKDESCHVSLRPLMVGTSEFVQARLGGCRTLGAVVDVVAASWNIIHGSRYNLVRRRGKMIAYVVDDREFPYSPGHDAAFIIVSIECLLVCVHVLLQSLADERTVLPLRAIRTRDRAPQAGASHLGFWGVPIRYNSAVYGLDYAAELDGIAVEPARFRALTARTLYGDVASLIDRLGQPAASGAGASIVERVEREIAAGRDQDAVAAALAMSTASLRRRLTEAGLSFRDVRMRVLASQARERLEGEMPIAEIAEALGFADGRSFARAFRQWTGTSPAAFRRSHRG